MIEQCEEDIQNIDEDIRRDISKETSDELDNELYTKERNIKDNPAKNIARKPQIKKR